MFGAIYFGSAPFAGTNRGTAAILTATTAEIRVSVEAALSIPVRLAAAATIALATAASLTVQIDLAADAPQIRIGTAATLSTPYGLDITIGGVPATGRVRRNGVTIRDVLNDAPNTATLLVEGDAPAVGQPIRITLGTAPPRVLFAGTLQTIDQRYESLPDHRVWSVTAIDDTGRANAKRPFGTWVNTSASTIAYAITAQCAPSFGNGIAAYLPAVSIVFDGSDTFIGALSRLATQIGGYCKIEDNTVYLFLDDVSDPPDPIDAAHPPLNSPPITVTTDSSQLRTRVYGKGYGEPIRADVNAGETLLPIQDGVQFPTAGGEAIAGVTAAGAQSLRLRYTGRMVQGGGTLVGPGAAPGVAPLLSLKDGTGVTDGTHTVSLVFVTANGVTLPGPPSSITVGMLAGPALPLTPGTPIPGIGPDEGTHDYVVTFVTSYGETNSGAVSAPVTTSATVGQLPPPPAPGAWPGYPEPGMGPDPGSHTYALTLINANGETPGTIGGTVATTASGGELAAPTGTPTVGAPIIGAGVTTGRAYRYVITFVNANGETTVGPPSGWVTPIANGGELAPPFAPTANTPTQGAGVTDGYHTYFVSYVNASGETPAIYGSNQVQTQAQLVGQTPPVTPGEIFYGVYGTTGGNLTPSSTYAYMQTYTTASGESLVGAGHQGNLSSAQNAMDLTLVTSPDPRVTGRKLYRVKGTIYDQLSNWRLCATIANNTQTAWKDLVSDASIVNAAPPPTVDTTANPGTMQPFNVVPITNIPIGPAGVTARKLYRLSAGSYGLVATISGNTTTAYTDVMPNANRGPAPPGTNTTGTFYERVPLTNIPLGPAGTTARKLYRAPDSLGMPGTNGNWQLVAQISGNTTTSFTDSTPNTALGPDAPSSNSTGEPYRRVPLTLVGGPAGTTKRSLYRQFNGAGPFKLVATLNDNTTGSYVDTKVNSALGATMPTVNTTGTAVQRVPLTNIPTGPLGVVARKIYRRMGGGWHYLVTSLNDNTTTVYTDATPNSGLGAGYTGANTAVGNQVVVSAIPVGPATVTGRQLFMSLAGGGPRHLAYTLADNVSREAWIAASDATLAGTGLEPTNDTSGLQQPIGQVNPGSTSLPLAAATTFPSTGWVVLAGGQVARYTGISGQTLVGIPASGAGAITTTLLYGSQALPAAMLTGVTGVTQPMLKGSAVHIWVQRDDLQAQAEERARAGGDGVIEYLWTDTRRGVDSLSERCSADLALFSRPIVTVGYACRDLKTKSGKAITIDLPGYGVIGPLIIQDVTITEIDAAANLPPRFSVRASSVRFSLEDVLRRMIAAENKGLR